MLDFASQNTPETGSEPSASLTGADAPSYWEVLLDDPTFILTSTMAPSRDVALANLLTAARAALEAAPDALLIIAEGWSDIAAADPSADDMALWHKKIDVYHPQYLELVEAIRVALPGATVLALPLGDVLSDVLALPELAQMQPGDFFSAQSPQGTALLTTTAGLIVQTARSQTPLPAEAWPLPDDIAFASDSIARTAYVAVGGMLVVQDPAGNESTDPNAETPMTRFLGTDGDDLIVFTPALESVQGGAGTDTFVVPISSAAAEISTDETGMLNLTLGGDIAIGLQDVERIAFEDGTLAFDEDGLAGQAYRLYQACFDRTPDAEGLGFWVKQLDAGAVTLTQTAELFLQSDEFAEVYGPAASLADVHYLALLYANVLGRVPDTEGFGFWREEQAKGVTRADMLVSFSESAENVALVAAAIDDGIWFI